jgi:hypothetical protein
MTSKVYPVFEDFARTARIDATRNQRNQWGQTRLIQTQSRNKSSLIPLIASGVMQDAFCGSNYKLGFP